MSLTRYRPLPKHQQQRAGCRISLDRQCHFGWAPVQHEHAELYPVGRSQCDNFVFSQVLSINNHNEAVGYYDAADGSQHGFLYNIKTGKYTFLDDPSEGTLTA